MVDLGGRLKKLMDLKNLSQAELSRQSGVSKSLVSDILNGRNVVTNDTLIKLAKALHVTPSYFMEEEILTPFDLLPAMPIELKEFMIKVESMPYLKLSKKAIENGITPEMLEGLLNTLIEGMNTLKKK